MKPYILILIVMCLSIMNCNNKKTAENTEAAVSPEISKLQEEVNRVHDEVMPKMGDLYKWKRKLQENDTTKSLDEKQKAAIKAAIQKLDSAYEGMMTWMHEYKPEDYEKDAAAAEQYLKKEIERINNVKREMLESLENAKTVAGEQ